MILKKISLENIRSYKKEELEFPEGSILLSGDIGSGKTSILLAVEFALFGLQPGQRGSSLLKNGAQTGGVTMEFEVDGKSIIVERTLKRSSKSIAQDYSAITIDGEKFEISVTELKDKILDILNYPREFSKKQNLLYKFTVYTPQEEMREIILQDAETRINTLRNIFGIDKYKRILENTSILTAKIREEQRVKEALISSLDKDKEFLMSKEEELETKHYNISSVEKELFLKAEIKKIILEEKNLLEVKINEKNRLEQEVDKAKIMIMNKKDSLMSNQKTIPDLEAQISDLKKLEFDESKIKDLEYEILSKKQEKIILYEKNLEISSKLSSFELKNREFDILKKKIGSIDICPTCLQNVAPVYKSNVFNKIDSDISENIKHIESSRIEKMKLSEALNKIEFEISSLEKKLQDFKITKVRLNEVKDKEKRLSDLKKLNTALEKDIIFLNSHSDSLKSSIFELKKYDNLFSEKQRELDSAMKDERIAEIKVAELKKEIEVFTRQIQELKERINKLEGLKQQSMHLNELESWVSKKFVSVISFVEKNVMAKLKQDFSKLFQEWFSMLVSETFNVKLDENFTPIIEQQDYELDYAYLSGGERTAIALAYRLALNQVINSLLGKIKTRDFVILDEPTDGFSDQQLDKMREVLDQLNVKQLIIVSHEQKIESFVDNVIRFRKENGVSRRV
ncbi:MAG: SMC family ATPase [Nanoarchaeota archaeon]